MGLQIIVHNQGSERSAIITCGWPWSPQPAKALVTLESLPLLREGKGRGTPESLERPFFEADAEEVPQSCLPMSAFSPPSML